MCFIVGVKNLVLDFEFIVCRPYLFVLIGDSILLMKDRSVNDWIKIS